MYEIRVFIAAFVAALIAVCVLPVLVSVNKPPPVEPDTERRFFFFLPPFEGTRLGW